MRPGAQLPGVELSRAPEIEQGMCPCACRRAIKRLHGFQRKRKSKTPLPSVTLADAMPDDAKPEPVKFPVVVEVNGVKVEVTLLLKSGTTVTVAETKATTEPEPRHCDDG